MVGSQDAAVCSEDYNPVDLPSFHPCFHSHCNFPLQAFRPSSPIPVAVGSNLGVVVAAGGAAVEAVVVAAAVVAAVAGH